MIPIDPLDTAAVDRLIADQNLFLAEYQKARAIAEFLNALKGWKDTVAQGQGKEGFHIPPVPVAPPGYVATLDPPPPALPAPNFTPVVQEEDSWGQFPAPGDENPAGTPIVWNGIHLVKVIRSTPWGDAHWWERPKT